MTTLLVTHPACSGHDMGEGHPERPERLRAVDQALEREAFQLLSRDSAPRAAIETLTRVHPADYVEAIERAPPTPGARPARRRHLDVAGHLGGGAALGRRRGLRRRRGDDRQGRQRLRRHAAARPSRRDGDADGLLLLQQRRRSPRAMPRPRTALERVAIVDFDVHHGNGTQDIFWGDQTVMYARPIRCRSIPAPARVSERGEHDQIVNAPLARRRRRRACFARRSRAAILPRLDAFAPDLVIISAGFDAPLPRSARQSQSASRPISPGRRAS